MRRKDFSSHLLAVTDGLVGSVTNIVLLHLYFLFSVGGIKTMGDANRVAEEVHQMLDEVNYQTIKQAIYQLRKTGMVTRKTTYDRTILSITKLGNQRIGELVPMYKTERPWDGHIYLISYDIPTRANSSRNLLRKYIRRTGGALLQESLWINPYNPTQILEEFVHDHGIPGTVLVSKLGTDGTIGDETLSELIIRVYKLDKLSQRYKDFLDAYRNPSGAPKTTAALDYLSILRDDPQLPFQLLPKSFPADAAWQRYQNFMELSR
ncbi:hypothetical protein HY409_04095 [Candidatus Gottesmanbacteria bacterium]|nr:hypothetical protein [Candidatus Gottesmanbacteria bacterium]